MIEKIVDNQESEHSMGNFVKSSGKVATCTETNSEIPKKKVPKQNKKDDK